MTLTKTMRVALCFRDFGPVASEHRDSSESWASNERARGNTSLPNLVYEVYDSALLYTMQRSLAAAWLKGAVRQLQG